MNLVVFGEKNNFYEIKKNLQIFNEKQNKNINLTFYEKREKFLNDISENKEQIVFLLHSKNFENIIEITKQILKINSNCKIIFCSKTEKFAVCGYKFNISFYLLIPINYSEFEFVIEKFSKKEQIIIHTNWQKIPILIDDIHFAEKQGHNIIIYTTNRKFSTRETFKIFSEKFKNKKYFVNCIRGTIVNLNWVDKIVLQNFIMKNGEKIPIRRQDRKKMKDLFFKYNKDKI